MGTLVEIIALVKELPESYLQKTLEKVKEIKEEADSEVDETETTCPRCQSAAVVRNGKKRGKHDVLWIAWRGVGEYMGGDKLEWAKGLKNKTIRRMIADCFAFVRDHDEYILDELKKGFSEGA